MLHKANNVENRCFSEPGDFNANPGPETVKSQHFTEKNHPRKPAFSFTRKGLNCVQYNNLIPKLDEIKFHLDNAVGRVHVCGITETFLK